MQGDGGIHRQYTDLYFEVQFVASSVNFYVRYAHKKRKWGYSWGLSALLCTTILIAVAGFLDIIVTLPCGDIQKLISFCAVLYIRYKFGHALFQFIILTNLMYLSLLLSFWVIRFNRVDFSANSFLAYLWLTERRNRV